jgi:hypothetical protein
LRGFSVSAERIAAPPMISRLPSRAANHPARSEISPRGSPGRSMTPL